MGKEVVLSHRLAALAELVTPGYRVCDVGCDHGFLSIYLVQKGISPAVVAMDVRSGPLSRAVEHIEEAGLGAYIQTRLSDGLESFQEGEAETLVCAGMGGRLMSRILTEGRAKARGLRELILQPQSELCFFREFLRREGYRCVAENMVEEDGKYYPMMKVVPAEEPIECVEPLYDLYGQGLLESRHPVLKQYLLLQMQTVEKIRTGLLVHRQEPTAAAEEANRRREERLRELDRELNQIQDALAWFV